MRTFIHSFVVVYYGSCARLSRLFKCAFEMLSYEPIRDTNRASLYINFSSRIIIVMPSTENFEFTIVSSCFTCEYMRNSTNLELAGNIDQFHLHLQILVNLWENRARRVSERLLMICIKYKTSFHFHFA